MIVGAYSVGAHAAWSRPSLAALVALAVAYNGVYAAAQGLGGSFTAVVSNLVWLVVPTGAWALGWYVRRRRLAAAASVETLRLERDQSESDWPRSCRSGCGWRASCTTSSRTA